MSFPKAFPSWLPALVALLPASSLAAQEAVWGDYFSVAGATQDGKSVVRVLVQREFPSNRNEPFRASNELRAFVVRFGEDGDTVALRKGKLVRRWDLANGVAGYQRMGAEVEIEGLGNLTVNLNAPPDLEIWFRPVLEASLRQPEDAILPLQPTMVPEHFSRWFPRHDGFVGAYYVATRGRLEERDRQFHERLWGAVKTMQLPEDGSFARYQVTTCSLLFGSGFGPGIHQSIDWSGL